MIREKMASVKNRDTKDTVLLTGATGFLGSHLLSALLKEGYKVVILIRSKSRLSRINHLMDNVFVYDIDEYELNDIFSSESIDIVIHVATNYGRTQQNELDIVNTNIVLGINLLKVAAKHGVGVFINTDTFFNIDNLPASHMQAYTLSKKQFIEWLKYFSLLGVSVVNMKIHHVYGPGDNIDKFVPWLQTSLINGSEPVKLTSGTQLRDFIYIDDVVNAFILAISTVDIEEKYIEYNVCTGIKTSVRDFSLELHSQIIDKYGVNVEIVFGVVPTSSDEIMDVNNDCSRLVSIGWNYLSPVRQGIKRMLGGSPPI
ncbi:NAD-dependent epimerase/dehydratase family protein [Amylibacter sp.]|nr:NAD-dependent epimerase/dehydratase family protein [Amylibacter sp.]